MSLAKLLLYRERQTVWFAKSPRTKGKRKRKKDGGGNGGVGFFLAPPGGAVPGSTSTGAP
eukprot:1358260-Rhodomonas_salina.1